MEHAVDLAIQIIKNHDEIESTPPMFHRNGFLYVLGTKGFVQVQTDLALKSWGDYVHPELNEAEDAVVDRVERERAKRAVYKPDEKAYFDLIDLGPSTSGFTLADMLKIGQELRKLPDDGRIRLVGTTSAYHGHKGGYDTEGDDVSVQRAGVLDTERYLEIAREKEDGLVAKLERIALELEKVVRPENIGRHIRETYHQLVFPDTIFLTEHVFVSFPRYGILNVGHGEDAWDKDSVFGDHLRPILHIRETSMRDSMPYSLKLAANNHKVVVQDPDALTAGQAEFGSAIGYGVGAVASTEAGGAYLQQYNKLHQAIRRFTL
jgi:hypothetical protein